MMKFPKPLYWVENEEFDALHHQVANNRLNISYADEVEAFYKDRINHADYQGIAYRAKGLLNVIYLVNGLPEKALAIQLQVLNPLSDEELIRAPAFLMGAINSSTELGRTDEVRPLVLRYINTKDNSDFSTVLIMINWYVMHYSNSPEATGEQFKAIFAAVASAYGHHPDFSLSFSDQMNFLHKKINRGNHALNDMEIEFKRVPVKSKEKIMADFLATDPLPLFRELGLKRFGEST